MKLPKVRITLYSKIIKFLVIISAIIALVDGKQSCKDKRSQTEATCPYYCYWSVHKFPSKYNPSECTNRSEGGPNRINYYGKHLPDCNTYEVSECPTGNVGTDRQKYQCSICTNVRDGGEICTSSAALQATNYSQPHCIHLWLPPQNKKLK